MLAHIFLFLAACIVKREVEEPNTPPELFVVEPATDASLPAGQPVVFALIVADAESDPMDLSVTIAVAGRVVASGPPDTVGRFRAEVELGAGSYNAVVVVVDPAGEDAERIAAFAVVPAELVSL